MHFIYIYFYHADEKMYKSYTETDGHSCSMYLFSSTQECVFFCIYFSKAFSKYYSSILSLIINKNKSLSLLSYCPMVHSFCQSLFTNKSFTLLCRCLRATSIWVTRNLVVRSDNLAASEDRIISSMSPKDKASLEVTTTSVQLIITFCGFKQKSTKFL